LYDLTGRQQDNYGNRSDAVAASNFSAIANILAIEANFLEISIFFGKFMADI